MKNTRTQSDCANASRPGSIQGLDPSARSNIEIKALHVSAKTCAMLPELTRTHRDALALKPVQKQSVGGRGYGERLIDPGDIALIVADFNTQVSVAHQRHRAG